MPQTDALREELLRTDDEFRHLHDEHQAAEKRLEELYHLSLPSQDDEIEEKMNKVSLVTLWIDPGEHQILQYTFDNMDMDFLPGRSIVRVDDLKASMKMSQPFPGIWLPAKIDMHFGLMTAVGAIAATYDVTYHDYRLAEVTTRIRP